ncbi:BRO family protein [Pseudomonas sp. P2757]|uniref:BRO family protein n=1 Tax=unclassified Pseudomonas TaxID=196821 RepID=UPI003B59C622
MTLATPALRFEPFQGPGLNLQVVMGHPKHELLFIATQVLNQAGLKDGKRQIQRYKEAEGMYQIKDLIREVSDLEAGSIEASHPLAPFINACKSLIGPRWKDGWVCTESVMYRILFRGNSPQSEPFRQWVCSILLPTLRKTGEYTYLPEHGERAVALAWEAFKSRAATDEQYAAKWTDRMEKLSGQKMLLEHRPL